MLFEILWYIQIEDKKSCGRNFYRQEKSSENLNSGLFLYHFSFAVLIQFLRKVSAWYPYIPYGKLTLLQGDPGDGKSTFMINIASALTRGGLLPDGKKLEQIGNVIYQGAEDNVGDTIKPRLEEAGADCDRVAFIDDADMGLTFIDDRLEKTIRSFQAKLLVLDPLQAFMPSNADMQNASHVVFGIPLARHSLTIAVHCSQRALCVILSIT